MVDNYYLLFNAVVEQAANDYREALIREHVGYEETNNDMKVRNIERFFKSPEFKTFTKLDGQKLMDAIKAEVIKCNYDMETIKESHLLRQGVG